VAGNRARRSEVRRGYSGPTKPMQCSVDNGNCLNGQQHPNLGRWRNLTMDGTKMVDMSVSHFQVTGHCLIATPVEMILRDVVAMYHRYMAAGEKFHTSRASASCTVKDGFRRHVGRVQSECQLKAEIEIR